MPKVFVLAILLTLFSMGECEQRQVKITKTSGTPAFLKTDVDSILNSDIRVGGQLLQDLLEGRQAKQVKQVKQVKSVLRSGAIVSCQAATYPNARLYGALFAMGTVPSAADCAAACWSASQAGYTCKAANYAATDQLCELFQNDAYSGASMYEDANTMVMMQIQCQQADDNEPTPAPEPAPAPQPQVSDIPPGTCGQTAVPIRAQRKFQRIINGTEAYQHSIPWIIRIINPGYPYWCGGTLLRVRPDKEESDIVVTAAHCVQTAAFNRPAMVAAGAHFLSSQVPGEVRVEIERDVSHENYSRPIAYANDITILKLAQPIKFSNTIQPACLPGPNDGPDVGTYGLVAGWGDLTTIKEDRAGSEVLMQVYVPVVDKTECQENYGRNSNLQYRVDPAMMLCAGYEAGGKDSCQGDSGGPLLFPGSKGHTLQGVVSWGDGCAVADKAGLYTRVTNYLDWIQKKIEELSDVYKS